MANDLLQRPDEDQDRAEQTSGVDELESLYNRPAIADDQRNTDSAPPSSDDLENKFAQPARKDEDRNTEKTGPGETADSGGSLLNRIPSGGGAFAVAGKIKGALSSKKKAGTLIGGGILLALMIFAMTVFFPSLKLIHFTQNIRDFFDGPLTEQMSGRMGSHLRVITDADGEKIKGFEERGSIFGRVARSALYSDLESRGFDVEFEEDGKLRRVRVNGEWIDAVDRPFSGQRGNRKILKGAISELYPEEGWLRRGVRARTLYTRLGLRLSISQRLSNVLADKFGSRLDDDLTRGKARIRQVMFGDSIDVQVAGAGLDASDQVDDDGNPTNRASENLDATGATDETSSRARTLAQEALDNPEESFRQSADIDEVASVGGRAAVRGSIKGSLRGFFGSGLATGGDYACRVKILGQNIETGSKILRASQLIKYSFEMFKFADHMKAGRLSAREVSGMMAVLDQTDSDGRGNMSESGAWRFISGDRTARPSNNDLNKYGTGGSIPFLSRANSITGGITGSNVGCKVVTNPFFQIGAGVGSAFLTLGSFGIYELLDTGASVAIGAVGEALLGIGETLMTQMVAGTVITGDETGAEAISALASGASSLSSRQAMNNGGSRVTNAEYSLALRQAHDRRVGEQQQKTLLARLLNVNDHRSLVAKVALESPTSPIGLARDVGLAPLRASPKTALAWVDSKLGQLQPHQVYADRNPEALAEDIFGNPVFLLDQAGFNQFDPEENEEYLQENGYLDGGARADEFQEYRDDCFNNYSIELIDPNSGDFGGGDFLEKCVGDGPNSLYLRFRTYTADSGVAQLLTEYTTREFGQTQGTTPAADGALNIPSSSNVQQLAQEILNHPNIEFQISRARGSFREIADTGRASLYTNGNSETTSISPKLLQLIIASAEAPDMPTVIINSLSTGRHSRNSAHYSGLAVDFDENGASGSADNELATSLMPFLYNNRQQLGIDELFLNIPEFCQYNLDRGQDTGCTDLDNHIHVSVNR